MTTNTTKFPLNQYVCSPQILEHSLGSYLSKEHGSLGREDKCRDKYSIVPGGKLIPM